MKKTLKKKWGIGLLVLPVIVLLVYGCVNIFISNISLRTILNLILLFINTLGVGIGAPLGIYFLFSARKNTKTITQKLYC